MWVFIAERSESGLLHYSLAENNILLNEMSALATCCGVGCVVPWMGWSAAVGFIRHGKPPVGSAQSPDRGWMWRAGLTAKFRQTQPWGPEERTKLQCLEPSPGDQRQTILFHLSLPPSHSPCFLPSLAFLPPSPSRFPWAVIHGQSRLPG